MLSAIARLLHPRRTRHSTRSPAAVVTASQRRNKPDDDERHLARSLAEALDEALAQGRRHQLTVLAQSAARIAQKHPQLTERLARLRLADNDSESALRLIDACTQRTASLRLLRCACLIATGRRGEAHQDLCTWCSHSTVPIDARLMLALLEWEAGDTEAARQQLIRNVRQLEPADERTLMALTCLAAEQRSEAAQQWAQLLRQSMWRRACTPDVDVLISTLNVTLPIAATRPTDQQLDGLVTELIAAEAAIPAMVESLEIESDASTADMLVCGIERGLEDFADQSAAIEALAKLCTLLDRRADARRWIDRGLELNPMSASLVLLRRTLDETTCQAPPQDHDSDGADQQHPRSKAA